MKLAIIGAGIAGLTLANKWRARGWSVTVFEKARGKAGRLTTKRKDWAHLDIGAQYFTARSDDFQMALEHWLNRRVVSEWDFTPYKVDQGVARPSEDNTIRYVGVPDMSSLAALLADSLEIHFSTRIETIQRHENQWSLTSHGGKTFSGYDWLVCTMPAEQTKALLEPNFAVAEQIPEKVHTPCWAVGVSTLGKVNPDIQGIFGDEMISWVSRQSAKPQRQIPSDSDDVWMIHFAPEWSAKEGKETKLDLVEVGMQWLETAVNAHLSQVHHHLHFWRFANLDPIEFAQPYLVDKDIQLGIVGDWCAGGKVEGAYLSAHQFDRLFA